MLRAKSELLKALVVLLAASSAGCGKFREVSLCRSISHDVNQAMDEIEALSKERPVDELRIAKRYGELASTLAPRALGDKPLAAAVHDYIAVLRLTDAAVRVHDAAQKAASTRSSESRRELERLVKREHAAATRIEVECHN